MLEDVPASDLDALQEQFRIAGANKIVTVLQDNGLWSVTAEYKE